MATISAVILCAELFRPLVAWQGMNRVQILKTTIISTAIVAAAALAWGPLWLEPENLDPTRPIAAQRALAIFVICMSLWLTNVIPLAATGLLAIALLPLLGVMPRDEAFSLFGNSAVFFMLGVFLLAAAMISTGLSKRLTLTFIQRFDRTPMQLVGGILVTSAFLSLWMPEHAVAAMIFPIILEIVDILKLDKGKSQYAKSLFMALAWGAIIGGIGTFLGGARTPLALGLLSKHMGEHGLISFTTWFAASAPVVVIMLVVAWLMLRYSLKCDVESIKAATQMLDERVKRLGPMSGRERRLAVLGLATVACWIGVGHEIGLGVIALCSATLLFVLQIVDWRQIQDYVNWGVLIMYGGAVALGTAMSQTHAFEWIVARVIPTDTPPMVVLAIMATAAIVLTEGISNSAAVAILLPIGFSMSDALGVDPITMTLAVTIPSGLAFSLPISSPPNAICFSAGYYSVQDVMRRGVVMSAIALVVLLVVMSVYWPMLGIGQGIEVESVGGALVGL